MYRHLQRKLASHVREFLRQKYDLEVANVAIEQPPNVELGEYALTLAFELAKKLRKAPKRIAEEIAEGLGDLLTHHRTTCDSFLNQEIVSAIKATGRKTLLISGVATELAVQLPALSASDQGYKVFVVLDACGGMSERTEQAALQRMAKAGATTVSVMTLAGELAGDFREAKAQQAIAILYEMAKG